MALQDARTKFSEVVSKAFYANEPTIITKSGKDAAVVISIGDYERFRRLEDQYDGELATSRLAEGNERHSVDEVESELGL